MIGENGRSAGARGWGVKAVMRALLMVLMAIWICGAWATERAKAQRAAFQRVNPCPATDRRTGACPGYVVDHIQPLCAGGVDHPSNMQWQTVADAKVKDREEIRLCRQLRR